MNIQKMEEKKEKVIYETVTTGLKVEFTPKDILIVERALGNACFDTIVLQLANKGFGMSRDEVVNCITNLYNAFRHFKNNS